MRNAGLWESEPKIRPVAWLQNFEQEDRLLAAKLLDRFIFHSNQAVERMISAAYNAVCDGIPKGPSAPDSQRLRSALINARFTHVSGETDNPTDSGYLFCRLARQYLQIPEELFVGHEEALRHSDAGGTVIFLDDFVGSGDQFLSCWHRSHLSVGNKSFSSIFAVKDFSAGYINLMSLSEGVEAIHRYVPGLAISVAHMVERYSTIWGLIDEGVFDEFQLRSFLDKYIPRLSFRDSYMTSDINFMRYGYKERGTLLAFSHSVPDSTLPIFWCAGEGWQPLIERV